MALVLVSVHVPNVCRRRTRVRFADDTDAAKSGTIDGGSNLVALLAEDGLEGEEGNVKESVREVNVAELCREFLVNSSSIIDFIAEFPYLNGPTKWTMFTFSCKNNFAEECLKRLGNLGIGNKGSGIGIVYVVPMHLQRFASSPLPRQPGIGDKERERNREEREADPKEYAAPSKVHPSDVSELPGGPTPAAPAQDSPAADGSAANLAAAAASAATGSGSISPAPDRPAARLSTTNLATVAAAIGHAKENGMNPAAVVEHAENGQSPLVSVENLLRAAAAESGKDVIAGSESSSSLSKDEGSNKEDDSAHEEFVDVDMDGEPAGDGIRIQVESEKSRFDQLTSNFMQTIRSRIAVDSVIELVNSSADFSFDYVMLVLVASVLACIGLVTNNVVVIVASMLVSPLMGPILAVTFGWTMSDQPMMKMGLFSELVGLLICAFVGFIGGLCAAPLIGETWPTTEMWSRSSLTAVYIGISIAIPSGVGVALSVLGNNTSSLVGVAISASLLPPAVNTGILLAVAALANTSYIDLDNHPEGPFSVTEILQGAGWSFLLTLANILCIWIAGIAMFKIKEVAPIEGKSDFWATHVPNARAYNTRALTRDDPEAVRIREAVRERLAAEGRSATVGVGPALGTLPYHPEATLNAMSARHLRHNPLFDETFFMPPEQSGDATTTSKESRKSSPWRRHAAKHRSGDAVGEPI